MTRKEMMKVNQIIVDYLVVLDQLRIKHRAFENALQEHDEVLYSLYKAKLKNQSRYESPALSEIRKTLLEMNLH